MGGAGAVGGMSRSSGGIIEAVSGVDTEASLFQPAEQDSVDHSNLHASGGLQQVQQRQLAALNDQLTGDETTALNHDLRALNDKLTRQHAAQQATNLELERQLVEKADEAAPAETQIGELIGALETALAQKTQETNTANATINALKAELASASLTAQPEQAVQEQNLVYSSQIAKLEAENVELRMLQAQHVVTIEQLEADLAEVRAELTSELAEAHAKLALGIGSRNALVVNADHNANTAYIGVPDAELLTVGALRTQVAELQNQLMGSEQEVQTAEMMAAHCSNEVQVLQAQLEKMQKQLDIDDDKEDTTEVAELEELAGASATLEVELIDPKTGETLYTCLFVIDTNRQSA